MNIFYLDKDPIIAAKMSCDKHVCKMIIESAQMLSTAHRMLDGEEYLQRNKNGNRNIKRWLMRDNLFETTLYKACHTGHPSTVWVMANIIHYVWLYKHMIALGDEFKLRYNHTKDHMTIQKLKDVLYHTPKNIPINKIATDPTPAMPDECKIPGDVIGSYRKYYIEKKIQFATWKLPSKPPKWWTEGVTNGIQVGR
jgi:hypothetical protein